MLPSKLPGKGTNIFTVMSKMASDHGAINLAQGFPDFDGPLALRERVAWHIAHNRNQYAPLAGVPELREQIAVKVLDLYGCQTDPESEIVVTPVSVFYEQAPDQQVIRFCFAKHEETLREAVKRLVNL